MKALAPISVVLLVVVVLCGCGRPRDGVLIDFEDEGQLDHLIWKCPVDMERAPGISGRGRYALTAHLLPGLYPGVEIWELPKNWSGYSALEFFIRAPEAAGETLHIRIDDAKSDEDFDSRYQGYRALEGGVQKIKIPLEEIRNGPKGRKLNLRRVDRIIVYLYRQDKRVTFTLDDFRLKAESSGPAADRAPRDFKNY